jgi:hypothetical protein
LSSAHMCRYGQVPPGSRRVALMSVGCSSRAVESRDLADRNESTIVDDTVKTAVHQPHVRDDNDVYHEENNRIH